ncbi:spore germination protein [Fictibacillus barbaricus]|uniref:Spore germination protein n=1 Tax=Fictibacillus barbaricus TaxID=182136 RepID=A0ABS2ZBV3_9BACL|nr:spore germination protein [Fictibacillus barbaricus]MBN3544144.1 spore germination protein [Fictibacillus barbaricus]GGB69286.1 spore germination protein [Fictibacillus barbaricus]
MSRNRFSRFFQKRKEPRNIDPLQVKNDSLGIKGLLSSELTVNTTLFKDTFQNCSDIVHRELLLGTEGVVRAQIIWMDGLVDKYAINDNIVNPLLQEYRLLQPNDVKNPHEIFSRIKDNLLSVSEIKEQNRFEDIILSVLSGETAILIDGVPLCIIASTKGGEIRPVSEPATESVVRGPRQGFTENLRTNTSLVRRIIKTTDLKMEKLISGEKTKTNIVISYIEGVADEKVIDEVKDRINKIKVDSIIESAYVEELIEDHPFSPFPQIAHTERPDKAAAELLEGRVVIFVEGSPFVLIVPSVFVQFLQSSEDYYERYLFSFAVRVVRYFVFLVALVLPSAYIAITTYHQEMLPTSLLISVAGAHEGVPFPSFIEALMMELTFEALREAGVRLPKPVGQAISIVGALVIGEAAVTAGIVSPPMVIVVAITAIASFAIPAFNIAISVRMLRFPLMMIAAILGFYGIMLGLMAMLIHLCSMRSFGVPYFTPVAPFSLSGMKDTIIRAPWWLMKKRPELISPKNKKRQETPRPDSSNK